MTTLLHAAAYVLQTPPFSLRHLIVQPLGLAVIGDKFEVSEPTQYLSALSGAVRI